MANPTELPTLSISTEVVCFIITKAKEFEAKDVATDVNPASNATDDHMVGVLEMGQDDPVLNEIGGHIRALNIDQQVELVALTWLGRGDGGLEAWEELRREAARVHNDRTAQYLLGLPLLATYLEYALDAFGRSCAATELEHL